MVFQHIHHPMPIYKDCTLFELVVVSIAILLVSSSTLSLLTWILFSYAAIGVALSLLTMVHTTRFLLGRLQRLKYGKPYGYYQHLFLSKCTQNNWANLFWKSPWVIRQGRWSVRRTL